MKMRLQHTANKMFLYLLECAEGCQDGSSDPDTVLPLRRSNHLDLHAARSQGSDLLAHPVSNSREHGGTTTEDDVAIQILPNIHVTLHDGVVGSLVDTSSFHSDEGWLEEDLRAAETLSTNGDDLTIRKLVALLHRGAGLGSLHLLVVVQGNVGELLLHVPHNFPLSSSGERVTTLSQDLHEVVSEVTTSKVKTQDGMGESVSLVDGDGVADTITRVEHDT